MVARRVLLLIPLLVTVVSCNGSLTSPGANPLTGTWVGTATTTINGSVLQGSMTVTLSESSGSSLTGTWASTSIGSGTLTGTVSGSSISMTLTPSVSTS